MNKFWIVLWHTYLTRIKSKAFIITSLIALLFIFGAANIESIINIFANDDKDKIAVIDTSNIYFEPLKEAIEVTGNHIELLSFEGTEKEAKKAVENEEYEAFLMLGINEAELPEATYFADSNASTNEQLLIQEQLQQLKVNTAIERAGIDALELEAIYEPVSFQTVALDQAAKTDDELNQARVVVTMMVVVMYLVVIIYGSMIINDVATEKSSRVMELLISSASPITHMFAKIFGIALLGLTQIGIFLAAGAALIAFKKDELVDGVLDTVGFLSIPYSLIIYGVVFFLFGYLLYATIAAMLGSLVSRSEDAQQLIMPLMLLIMVGYFIAIFGLAAPESKLVTISSFIPFFSPMLMLLRVGMLNVPVWEIALSMGILVGTIILLGIFAARVYKGGVLMYGNSSIFKDFKKALALSKKE